MNSHSKNSICIIIMKDIYSLEGTSFRLFEKSYEHILFKTISMPLITSDAANRSWTAHIAGRIKPKLLWPRTTVRQANLNTTFQVHIPGLLSCHLLTPILLFLASMMSLISLCIWSNPPELPHTLKLKFRHKIFSVYSNSKWPLSLNFWISISYTIWWWK